MTAMHPTGVSKATAQRDSGAQAKQHAIASEPHYQQLADEINEVLDAALPRRRRRHWHRSGQGARRPSPSRPTKSRPDVGRPNQIRPA
jgi:hypothetical protein